MNSESAAPVDTTAITLPRGDFPVNEALPAGWMRSQDGQAVNVGAFLRAVLFSMSAGATNRTHDNQMLQVYAAAAACEIARALAPAHGAFMEQLCFPDIEPGGPGPSEWNPLDPKSAVGGTFHRSLQRDLTFAIDGGVRYDCSHMNVTPGQLVQVDVTRLPTEADRLAVWVDRDGEQVFLGSAIRCEHLEGAAALLSSFRRGGA